MGGVISAPTAVLRFQPEENLVSLILSDGVLHQSPGPDRDVMIRFKEMNFSIGIPNIVQRFARVGREGQNLSPARLNERIAELNRVLSRPLDATMHKWYFQQLKSLEAERALRLSQPFACLIMAFVGALLGLQARWSRRSACYSLTIATLFLYYTLLTFGRSYAEDGSIPTWLGVWLPNVVSLAVGMVLYRKTREMGAS